MSRGLYRGQYAGENDHEYFAEISCAYFNFLEYTPHNRSELRKYDSMGYRLMESTWGSSATVSDPTVRLQRERTAGA